VFAAQAEFSFFIMVEFVFLPGGVCVAVVAFLSVSSLVVIIVFMAAMTCIWQFFLDIRVIMAAVASRFFVFPEE
jgi:hypothetical protein